MLFLCAEDFHLREGFARSDLPSSKAVDSLLRNLFTLPPKQSDHGTVIEAASYQQSKQFDCKESTIKSIMAQLELRFELLRAITPKYSDYSYKSLKPTDHDASSIAMAIRRHTAAEKRGKTLTHVDVDTVARSARLQRADVVTKLNDWNDAGLIDLKTAGVVNVYRVLKELPSTPAEQKSIIDKVYRELEVREQQDLARMDEVFKLITGSACLTRTLAEHFGDSLPDQRLECGHCQWCITHKAVEMVVPPKRAWDSKGFAAVLQACPDRDDPRYLARVAFGMKP